MKYFLLIIFGAIGGVLGGMGMGGGTLLIPLLTIFSKLSQYESQAINLIAFLPMSLIALIVHAKNHLVDFKISISIAISGVASAVLSAIVTNKINSKGLSFWFGVFLIVVGVFQIVSIWIFKNHPDSIKKYVKKID